MPLKKIPPNPLPCGCGVKGILDLENAIDTGHSLRVGWRDTHVVHCHLHNAAEKLLAACKQTFAAIEDCRQRIGFPTMAIADAFDACKEAIKFAKKGK